MRGRPGRNGRCGTVPETSGLRLYGGVLAMAWLLHSHGWLRWTAVARGRAGQTDLGASRSGAPGL